MVQVGVEEAVVTDGLVPGDRLITSNLQLVVEGMPLRAGSADAAMAALEELATATPRQPRACLQPMAGCVPVTSR